jgi:hypothetical protein
VFSVAKVVGVEHGGAEGGRPFEDLGSEVVKESSRSPATKKHDVGRGMTG